MLVAALRLLARLLARLPLVLAAPCRRCARVDRLLVLAALRRANAGKPLCERRMQWRWRNAKRCCAPRSRKPARACGAPRRLVRQRREGGAARGRLRRGGTSWKRRARAARASSFSRRTSAASRCRPLYVAQRLPLTVLYRPPKQRWLEPLMIAGRRRWQATVAPANLQRRAHALRALQHGRSGGLAARPGAEWRGRRVGGFLRALRPTP